jgi:SlyX protein
MNQQLIENRLEKIETKLAFLEDFLRALQEAALEEKTRLDETRTEQNALKTLLLRLSRDQESPPERRPPHY